jgi:hypothetical protein
MKMVIGKMVMRKSSLIICLGIMLVSGCTKRYWFRSKIDVPHSKRYSVKINIVNRSPECLTGEFITAMHQAAAKYLQKWGYYETHIKSPTYIYTLTLRVDSFDQSRKRFDGQNIPPKLLLGDRNFVYGEAAIVFTSELDHKQFGRKWSKFYDIYYFGEKRDISRSKGVVKLLIKMAEEKRYLY